MLPVLRWLTMERLKAHAARCVLIQDLHLGLGADELLSLYPHRYPILPLRLQLDRLHYARVLRSILAEALHTKRRTATMCHIVVGKSSDALVVLKTPPSHVVTVSILKVTVNDPGWVVGLEVKKAVAGREERILA